MIVFTSTLTARGAYMFGGMSIAYLLIIYSNGYDEKNKSEIILNSLPVRRDSIVTAKYVSIFLFFLLGVAITGVAGAVITPMNIIPGMRFMRLSDVLGIFISVGLMYSVYYPLYFKFGSLKLKIFNIVIYMLFLFVPNILVSIIEENPNDNIVRKVISIIEWSPAWMLQIFTIIVIMIVLIVSMEMSIKIYRNKEF
jgi:ABC-type transport system involved in multi-copper enzyme maturation permease subunit